MERKGISLVVALIVLLLLALLGASIMMLSVNEEKYINARIGKIRALAYAKAGGAEVIRRLSLEPSEPLYIGESGETYNPGWKTYILLTTEPPENNPPLYYKSSLQISLPDSQRLIYTTKDVEPKYSLVVHHKVNRENSDEIYFYNWKDKREESHEPSTYRGRFFPVEVIEAVGRVGNASSKIRVEVVRESKPVRIAAALSCNCDVTIKGKLVCCGHNHRFSTPWGTDVGKERYACFDDLDDPNDPVWHIRRDDGKTHSIKHFKETSNSDSFYMKDEVEIQCSEKGCLPGISAPGHKINLLPRSTVRGNPDTTTDSTVAGFCNICKVFDVSNEEELEDKYPWEEIVPGEIKDGRYTGFYRCNGDLRISGVVNFTGVLWVKGNIEQRGHLFAKGFIYSEKGSYFNGNFWLLGAVAIEGNSQVRLKPFNGSGVLLYSSDAIERAIAQGQNYHIISHRGE